MQLKAVFLVFLALAVGLSIPFINFLPGSGDFYGSRIELQSPDFTLTSSENRPLQLADFRGQFVYLMFGYLGCEDVCHAQVFTLQALHRLLDDPGVQFVYIAMDPDSDSHSELDPYFRSSQQNFHVLMPANRKKAQSLAASFRAYFSAQPVNNGDDYRLNHPGYIYLLDPDGKIRLLYQGQALRADKMASDLQHLKTLI